ncbi:M28 family metallopeptidase [Vallitalea guaymasensis]|uniref:M28 family metallopeptidase n=1 Tax=Vallitalea guaymasensis TaxID=1185412 RepID=UPI000DE454C8|nr:M28 family peptidase [Vallitalea guaymasensis]
MRKKITVPAKIMTLVLLTYLIIPALQPSLAHSNHHGKNTIRETIETLASEEFMGRLVGTEGNEKTIDYITNFYDNIDLEKYDEDYYFENDVTTYHPDQQIHHLEAVFKDGTSKVYTYGQDYIDSPIMKETNIQSKITFDINDPDMKNKILVVDRRIKSIENKGTFMKVDTLRKNIGVYPLPSPTVQITENLYTDLKTKDIDYIKFHNKYVPKESKVKSVIGKISGTDSSKALILSAHLDHVGWAGDTIYCGASDNASGISAILELARKLKHRSEHRPFDMDIIIAAFNAEESGLDCSCDFVPAIKEQYDNIYNINIDTIGKIDGGSLTINGNYKEQYVNKFLKQSLLNCFNNNHVELLNEFYGMSDHYYFLHNKIPAVTLGQKDVLGENNTTSIHTKYDTIDTIDFNQIKKITNTLFDFIIKNDGVVFKPETTFKRTMETIASPEFMGRLPGTEGNEKTVEYITDFYEEIGLDTYDEDYYHDTIQTVFNPDEQTANLEISFADGTSKTYKYGEDYIDYPSLIATNINTTITFDKEDSDIENKILVIDKDDTTSRWEIKAKAIFQQTDSMFRITKLFAEPTNYIQVSNKLYNDLKTKDITNVDLQLSYNTKKANIKSVVGKIKGIDSTKAVVLSAHLDHVGWAGDTIFCGAVDNGSGITTILELAKRLQERSKEQPFETDIIIAAFNGEDSLLSCTEDFVLDMMDKYDEFYDINIDTIGKSDGGLICMNGMFEESNLNTTLKESISNSFRYNGLLVLDETYGGSDHRLFNKYNIPGITLGQKDVFGENGTTKIHTKEDTIDIIDYFQIEQVTDILYDFIITNDGTIYKPLETLKKSA